MGGRRQFIAALAAFSLVPKICSAESTTREMLDDYITQPKSLNALNQLIHEYSRKAYAIPYYEGMPLRDCNLKNEIDKATYFTSWVLDSKLEKPPIPTALDFEQGMTITGEALMSYHFTHLGYFNPDTRDIIVCINTGSYLFQNVYSHELTHYFIAKSKPDCAKMGAELEEGIARCVQETAMDKMSQIHQRPELANIAHITILNDLLGAKRHYLGDNSVRNQMPRKLEKHDKGTTELSHQTLDNAIGTTALKIMQRRKNRYAHVDLYNGDSEYLIDLMT